MQNWYTKLEDKAMVKFEKSRQTKIFENDLSSGISSTMQSIGSPMYCLEVTKRDATTKMIKVAL